MTLLLGTQTRGQYSVVIPAFPVTCQSYYFTVTNKDGNFYLPESGYYTTTWNGVVQGFSVGVGVCTDNWLPSPVQVTVTPPPLQLEPCTGRAYWLQLGPGTGPWGPALLVSDGVDPSFNSMAFKSPASSPSQGKLFLPVISLKIFFDETNFGNGSFIPELPLTGSYAGDVYQGSVASSFNGVNQVALQNPGGVLTSNNSGEDWHYQPGGPQGPWQAVDSSGDGSKLVAVMQTDSNGNPGFIWTSNDTGMTWYLQRGAPQAYWTGAASSFDGTKFVAVQALSASGQLGGIFLSRDSGMSWVQSSAPGGRWSTVCSSGDGSKLVAAQIRSIDITSPSLMYQSTDFGIAWKVLQGAGLGYWLNVASSLDGSKLLATQTRGRSGLPGTGVALVSTDSGRNWVKPTTIPYAFYTGASVSGTFVYYCSSSSLLPVFPCPQPLE